MIRKSEIAMMPLAVLLSLLLSCQTTEPISRQFELEQQTGPITVITQDTTVYTLDRYLVKDSTLRGSGHRKKDQIQDSFSGTLPLSEISYIQASHTDGMKTILALAAAGVVTGTVISNISGGEATQGIHLTPNVRYVFPYSGGGGGGTGSCPYIYSWNGQRYVLEAEAYGIAWGKALEMSTSSVLPSLRPDNDVLKVALSNERPETHYYNAVHLKAVQTDLSAEVFSDNTFNFWPVHSPVAPCFATDHSNRVVTGALAAADGQSWESDLKNIASPSTFQDTLRLSFARTSDQNEGTLIIRAINTRLNDVVFRNLFAFLGDESLEFVRAVEHDQELISILKDWIEEISLKVSMWNGKEWERVSTIHPEANSVPFAKACRIRPPGFPYDTVRIQLTCLSDVWRLDAVHMDWTATRKLAPLDVPLISATGPDHRDVSAQLKFADDNYLMLLPPERIELRFKALQTPKGKKTTYVVDVQGYLHEWIPQAAKGATVIPTIWMKGSTKIAYLKGILRMKNVFLPPMYAEWRQSKDTATEIHPVH